MRTLVLTAALCLVGCEGTRGGERALRGNVSTSQFALTSATVVVETASGRRTSAALGDKGAFQVLVPLGEEARVVLATRTSTGRLRAVARIGPEWFTLKPGAPVDLGVVRPAGAQKPSGLVGGTPGAACMDDEGADLPYAAKLPLGKTWRLSDSFAEKGPQPAKVLDVTMEGPAWRLTELRNNTAFTVTQADCDHVGGRDVGRDRAFVTWQDPDGSIETDHIDMRYCKDDSSGSSTPSPAAPAPAGECDEDDDDVLEVCGLDSADTDGDDALIPSVPGTVPAGTCPGGSVCTSSSQCSSQLCVNGTCGSGGGGGAGSKTDAGIN